MLNKSFHKQNRENVLGSRILAKAVLDCGDHYRIIVVFALSTGSEFYWIFRARSPRSARRSWRFINWIPLARSSSFDSLVYDHGRMNNGATLSRKISHKKKLKAITEKPEHFSIFADWSERTGIQTFDLIKKKLERGRRGRLSFLYR